MNKFLILLLIFGLLGCESKTNSVRSGGQAIPVSKMRGLGRVVIEQGGAGLPLYRESHALLIGNIDYQYLSKLPHIKTELEQIDAVLKVQGFTVHQKWNLNGDELKKTIRDFLTDYGSGAKNSDNRLLVYYSGHGDSVLGLGSSPFGYIVPVDAPSSRKNKAEFIKTALNMDEIVNWSKLVETKHILFLFDSCFSGSVLQATRSDDTPPAHIQSLVKNPVRKFLTAGSAGEKVPSVSAFALALVRALGKGMADYTKDGFITGSELAMYLAQEVPKYTQPINSPQVGEFGIEQGQAVGDIVFNNPVKFERGHDDAAPQPEQNSTGNRVKQALSPPSVGHLQISSNVDHAEVFLNGRYQRQLQLGKALNLTQLPVAEYKIKITAKGYQDYQKTINVEPHLWKQIAAYLEKERIIDRFGITLIPIQTGCFDMGSPMSETGREGNEHQHNVCVDAFKMAETEVTQGQWRVVMGHDPENLQFKGCGDNCPVEGVSWKEVQIFIKKLNQQTGQHYRLPTEAEWEYAARAGTSTARYWGNDTGSACRYANVHDQTSKSENRFFWQSHACIDGYAHTAPVRTYKKNAWGLYDMLGNVWEWTCSRYVKTYDGGEKVCHNDATAFFVLRGSSWSSKPEGVRSAYRFRRSADARNGHIGFRLAQD